MHPGDLRSARAGELPRPRVSPDALTPTLAVVVPTIDEAEQLGALLDDLAAQTLDLQIVVADGGSTDGTRRMAERRGVKVVEASRGRAHQMNAGRAAVETDWLLFLHADTRIEDEDLLARALDALEEHQCGHFRVRFRTDDWRFRYLEAKTALNRPYTTNGDQGLLVSAALFDELGGFDTSLEFLEDQRFVARAIASDADLVTLPGTISTSARGFRRIGFGRRYFSMAVMMSAWGGGAHELFERHPELYNEDLGGLIAAVRETTAALGPRRAFECYMSAARFIRGQAWQLFFVGDVALRDELPEGRTPLLDFYDAHLADLDVPGLDGLVAAAAFLLLNLVLTPD